MSAVPLSLLDLALAASLILINGAVSLAFRLGLEKQLAIVTIRMVVQLATIGYVLKLIFAQTSPWWTLALATVMILAAGQEAIARGETRIADLLSYGLGAGTFKGQQEGDSHALGQFLNTVRNRLAADPLEEIIQ